MAEFKLIKSCLPQHPCRVLLSGPTMSGKTSFCRNLLLHPEAPYEALYICAYRLDQPAYSEIINSYKARGLPVHTYTNIPEEPIDFDKDKKNCLVVDDLIEEAEKSKYMGHLLRDGSHHDNLTVILISHWCCGSADGRRQRLQMDYMILFRFPADKKAVHGLACQISSPGKVNRFMDIYNDATSEKFRPLILDLSNSFYIDPRLRFRCDWNIIYDNTEDI